MREKLEAVKFSKCGCNINCTFVNVSFNGRSRGMQDLALAKSLAKGVIYHPVISNQGLLKFSRTKNVWEEYAIEDTENLIKCHPCEDGVRGAFGKHPLKYGESITFYLQEA